MSKLITDVLDKPDMQAVLERTHLALDLRGFLLPIFEAISNAMDGIHSRFGDEGQQKGEINIKFSNTNSPAKILVSVSDNGIGLTDENYKSFRTPFSGYKLKQRGRGFGRFIAFKVFSRTLYSSSYEFFHVENTRTFRFDINQKQEFTFHDGDPDFSGVGLCVEYNQPLAIWHQLIKDLKASEVMDEIGNHFLPYFLYRWLPKITIQFDERQPENITSHFKDVFVQYDTGNIQCDIDGTAESLTYSLTRIPKSRTFKSHCLLFSAADRIVGFPKDLTNKLGEAHFVNDKDEKYIVIAVVRGEAFERRLNDSRTSIDLPAKVVENIVSAVSDVIQSKEAVQIAKIKEGQSAELVDGI
jgi:hypothetical protein